jgi:hypothetical protein
VVAKSRHGTAEWHSVLLWLSSAGYLSQETSSATSKNYVEFVGNIDEWFGSREGSGCHPRIGCVPSKCAEVCCIVCYQCHWPLAISETLDEMGIKEVAVCNVHHPFAMVEPSLLFDPVADLKVALYKTASVVLLNQPLKWHHCANYKRVARRSGSTITSPVVYKLFVSQPYCMLIQVPAFSLVHTLSHQWVRRTIDRLIQYS